MTEPVTRPTLEGTAECDCGAGWTNGYRDGVHVDDRTGEHSRYCSLHGVPKLRPGFRTPAVGQAPALAAENQRLREVMTASVLELEAARHAIADRTSLADAHVAMALYGLDAALASAAPLLEDDDQ